MTYSYGDWQRILDGASLPAVVVDLDAFDRNLDRQIRVAEGLPLRLASKSVRVPSLLRRALDHGGSRLKGLLCYAAAEAEDLVDDGFDDLVIAYPIFREGDVQRVCGLVRRGLTVRIVADEADSVTQLARIAAREGVKLPVLICVDMSLRLLGDRVHVGVRRSPVATPQSVVALARQIADSPSLIFSGLLAYEAQVAGLPDQLPRQPVMNLIKSSVRRWSIHAVSELRRAMVQALDDAGLHPALVNGGGTGSLDSTTVESGVTEVSAGSGLYKPHLFDGYRNPHMRELEPSCFFALEVTRRPGPHLVTCLGGGYVASGPPGVDRLPRPWLPLGAALLPAEMTGEVQTPLTLPEGTRLSLGDPVLFRHAKAGELMERFVEVTLVSDGRIVGHEPTYRGLGRSYF